DGREEDQVRVLDLDGVELDAREQVVRGGTQDDGRGRAEAAREVADRHAGPVDPAVVTGEEQVHVRVVGDERLVDGTGRGVGDAAGEQHLLRRPAVRVGRVGRGPVGEGRAAPLVG